MSVPLFASDDMSMLYNTYTEAMNKMLEEYYEPYVALVLDGYAHDIRMQKSAIMDSLKNEMKGVPQAEEFWAKTVSFYSRKYAKGTKFLENENSRYEIWRYSSLCKKLLEELQLDPSVFSFKITSQYILEVDIGIEEYYNTIMLVYKP